MKKDDEKLVQQVFEGYFTKSDKFKKEQAAKLIKISELYARKQWQRLYLGQMYNSFKRLQRKDVFMLLDMVLQKQWKQNRQNEYRLAISQSIVEYFTFIFPLIFEYRHQDLIIEFKTYRMLWVKLITDEAFDQLRIEIKKIYKQIDLNTGFTSQIMNKINKSFEIKKLTEQEIQRYMSNHQSQNNSKSRQRDSSQDENQHYNARKKVKYDPTVEERYGFQSNVGSNQINPQVNHFGYNDHHISNNTFNHHPHSLPNYNANSYPNSRLNMQPMHPYINPLGTTQHAPGINPNYMPNNAAKNVPFQNMNLHNSSLNGVNRQPSSMRNPNISYNNIPNNPLGYQMNPLSNPPLKIQDNYHYNQVIRPGLSPIRQSLSPVPYTEYNNQAHMSNKLSSIKPNMSMNPAMKSPTPPPPSSNSHHSTNIQLRQPYNFMRQRQQAQNVNYYNVGSPPPNPAISPIPQAYKPQPSHKAFRESNKFSLQKQKCMQILSNLKKSTFECKECGLRFLIHQNLQKHQYEHFADAQRKFQLKQGQTGLNVAVVRKQRLQNFDMLFDVNQWIMSNDEKRDLTNFKVSISRLTNLSISYFSHQCFYCNEQIKMSWCDKLQEWCLEQSLKVKDEYIGLRVAHVNCYECFNKDTALESTAIL